MLQDVNIGNERRLVVRLRKYWDMIRDDNPVPPYEKFNQSLIQDIWDNCMVFQISANSKSNVYKCSYVGHLLQDAFGRELKDSYISAHDKRFLPGSNLVEFMDKCVNEKDFTLFQGQFVNHQNKIVKYRNCIMPFIDTKNNIKHLVIGLSWRAF